ncbi:MAG: peptide chain release factor N(5)-glutamine methyltransferase [Devosia sp.]|uniref:N5-glutamine methyltransferase family protein n=1 Tax=Devosia sp. TaxID=1871048 RepID=UPI0024C55E59|nr:HemK/PrmC family methyltransferase [Devosia sp.]UYN98409.1 MAG: peptide chain release factor N(5)-glutamine methyltransferase [Devosia sp.]
MTIGALWRGWRDVLARQGFATAALDAKLLTGQGLGLDMLALTVREDMPVEETGAARVAALIQRRLAGESVARIIGEREFYGLPFGLNAATLEPRPETELLVDLALKDLPENALMLDLGTGSGCIPIAILANRPDVSGVATDISAEALAIAAVNAARNGVAERLRFAQGDWFGALIENPHPSPPHKGEGASSVAGSAPPPSTGGGRVGVPPQRLHLITSNPPYIDSAVVETLAPEVKDFDPRLALDGGPDGLGPYRIIAATAGRHLVPGGRVLVEIGHDQGVAVAELFARSGFGEIAVHKDLAGLDRVVCAHHMG